MFKYYGDCWYCGHGKNRAGKCMRCGRMPKPKRISRADLKRKLRATCTPWLGLPYHVVVCSGRTRFSTQHPSLAEAWDQYKDLVCVHGTLNVGIRSMNTNCMITDFVNIGLPQRQAWKRARIARAVELKNITQVQADDLMREMGV